MKRTIPTQRVLWSVAASVGLAFFRCTLPATAATTNVTVENFDFNPSEVTIKTNDSVTWTWSSGITAHSTTSDGGLWNSGQHPSPFSFTNQFTSAGNFPYHCTVHFFMSGSV